MRHFLLWSTINRQATARQVRIRQATGEDAVAVFQVNSLAFETHAEANLVDRLSKDSGFALSLVAVESGERDDGKHEQIVGHIMFSEVQLDSPANNTGASPKIIALAPMCVRPDRQQTGIGAQLVEHGAYCCLKLGYDAIVVLGHPNYYPKFGFKQSLEFGIKSEYPVPGEVFMLRPLTNSALTTGVFKNCISIIKYNRAFDNL